MKQTKAMYVATAAMIAALYVVLTFVANAFGLANYAIQVRFSEALTILPFFTPAAVPGLFVGCLLANIFTGCAIQDVIAGSLTTLVAAIISYMIGHVGVPADTPFHKVALWRKLLVPVPPTVLNMIVVPFVLAYVYEIEGTILYFMATVGIGEVISCGILGLALLFAIQKPMQKLLTN